MFKSKTPFILIFVLVIFQQEIMTIQEINQLLFNRFKNILEIYFNANQFEKKGYHLLIGQLNH